MADICDQADEVIAEDLNHALANIPRYEGVSATECEECGDDIPNERREAVRGATTCFECACRIELAKKGVRRV